MRIRFILFAVYLVFLSALAYFLFSDIIKEKKIQVKKIASIASTPSPVPALSDSKKDGLKQEVGKALKDTEGNFGIVIRSLNNEEDYYYNADEKFQTASLYKLWVMATAFDMIQKGKIKEDENVSQKIDVLNNKFDIDPEYADQTKGRISYSVQEALEKMITISDNYTALLLSEKLSLSAIQQYLEKKGFRNSKLGVPPVSTPLDISIFFEKLYKGELADGESTNKMLTMLKNQQLNKKIPKYLPKKTLIAHKTGELDSVTHDAGIVYSEKGDYIIVVMSESKNRVKAEETIAKVSKAVFDYFQEE